MWVVTTFWLFVVRRAHLTGTTSHSTSTPLRRLSRVTSSYSYGLWYALSTADGLLYYVQTNTEVSAADPLQRLFNLQEWLQRGPKPDLDGSPLWGPGLLFLRHGVLRL